MKINGIAIEEVPSETMKVSMLNMYLGAGGAPKYTQNQLKGKNKAALLEELMPIYEAHLVEHEAKPKRAPREGAARGGAKTHESKNKKSTQSKLCHLRADLLSGKKTAEQATEIWHGDSWLQKLTTLDALLSIKERPGSGNHGTKKRETDYTVNSEAMALVLAAGERLMADGYILADVPSQENDEALGEPADGGPAPLHVDNDETWDWAALEESATEE